VQQTHSEGGAEERKEDILTALPVVANKSEESDEKMRDKGKARF
jgi:hypothetical protein